MINFNTFLPILLLINPSVTYAKLSDKRLCANQDCTELISLAKTLLSYNSPENGVLSFHQNQEVKIFSKSAGSNENLWGAEIKGVRGYIPKNLVREYKLLKGKLDFLISTENETEKPKETIVTTTEKAAQEQISPESVKKPFEVIGGTTIYTYDDTDVYDATANGSLAKVQESEKGQEENTVKPTPQPEKIEENLNTKPLENVPPKVEDVNNNKLDGTTGKILDNIKAALTGKIENKENIENNELSSEDEDDEGEVEEEEEENKPHSVETPKKETNTVETMKNTENVIPTPKVISENLKQDSFAKEEIKTVTGDTIQKTENVISPLNVISGNLNQDSLHKKEIKTDTVDTIQETDNEISPLNVISENLKHDSFAKEEIKTGTVDTIQKTENVISPLNVISGNLNQDSLHKKEIKTDTVDTIQETDNVISPLNVISGNLNLVHNEEIKIDTIETIKNTENVISRQDSLPNILNTLSSPSPLDIKAPIIDLNVKEVPLNNPEQTERTPDKHEYVVPETKVPEEINILSTETNKETITEATGKSDILFDTTTIVPNVQSSQEPVEPKSVLEQSTIVPNVQFPPEKVDIPKATTIVPNVQFTTENGVVQELPPPNFETLTESFTENPLKDQENEEEKTEPPFVQALTSSSTESTTETAVEIEENYEIKPEEEPVETNESGDGIFSKLYTGLFGNKEGNEEKTNEIEEKTMDESIQFQENEVTTPVNVIEAIQQSEVVKVVQETIEEIPQITEIPVIFDSKQNDIHPQNSETFEKHTHEKPFDKYLQNNEDLNKVSYDMDSCDRSQNPSECYAQFQQKPETSEDSTWSFAVLENWYSLLLYMSLTAITVLLFVLGHYYIEKRRIDGTLISNINTLEKKLLVTSKENLLLHDELKSTKDRLLSIEDSSFGTDEMVTALKEELEEAKNTRIELEEHIANLERELENATEAGLELNRMVAEILSSQNGNETLMHNVESLQKQLFEQQTTINNTNATLNTKTTENELLRTELSVSNDKIEQLQTELDRMVVNLLTVQEEKSKIESESEEQSKLSREEFEMKIKTISNDLNALQKDNNVLREKVSELKSQLGLKINEYTVLKESMNEVQSINTNKESLAALLDVSKVKAEVQQLREEKRKLTERAKTEKESKTVAEKQVQVVMQEMRILKDKYEEADKDKVEAQTRLDVLSAYFKEKETQLQKEINENEQLWVQKQGEATSTVERIKWIQEELQNYKSQNELLKKEIVDQEVSLKSQISMLEKKAHDNWVLTRQAERKLEESRQEASQLRNRLTVVEKNLSNSTLINQIDDGKMQNNMLPPMPSNGDIAVSPLHMGTGEPSRSPPLLPPLSSPMPGLPPFMPPPGVPFMPPPPGVPPFMPPLPPSLYPGDHRPPPLGRMSSPPIHGRYSPDSRTYSPYDRDDSPPMSPTYPDSDYRRGRSPPPPDRSRTFSPYSNKSRGREWEERDYRDRPLQQRLKPRSRKGTGLSSGSGNSNESLDNSGRHSGRV